MPQTVNTENNFLRGLITEATGLNFPENAATDTSNCVYSLIGDVSRREGINFEVNGSNLSVDRTNKALSSYIWPNAGGDGLTKLLVRQVGSLLYFYSVSSATTLAPISSQKLASTIDMSTFTSSGVFDSTQECQYANGNGYLFVLHPSCDPVFCSYSLQAVTGQSIQIKIRDFVGFPESTPVNTRPISLSNEHLYNLINQGWVKGTPWDFSCNDNVLIQPGADVTFTAPTGLTVFNNGDNINAVNKRPFINNHNTSVGSGNIIFSGTVISYNSVSGALVVNITTVPASPATGGMTLPSGSPFVGGSGNFWDVYSTNKGFINTWQSVEGNFPSNADVWWYFKDNTGAFNPASTANNVTLASGNAPKGHFTVNAFNIDRGSLISTVGMTAVSTNARPTNGAFFQGRVWYTGVNSSQQATGDAGFYTWTENIYFSQIVESAVDFGLCYQQNDPTSENLFDLLPTDGGVITIPGAGQIFKLFPTQNGMLVFASNGVWFITGSAGIGFSASDYTVTKISSVQSISSTSFVDVMGLPYFWNQEGIYQVMVSQNGSMEIVPITVGTILSFYNDIPAGSKKYVRGDYNYIDYTIQWTYLSTGETSVTNRYEFDKILNYNVYTHAFFPWTIVSNTLNQHIHDVKYIVYPVITSNTPEAGFKYPSSYNSSSYQLNISEEYDTTYQDWGAVNYVSFFETGYKIRGQGIHKYQPQYIQIYLRQSSTGGNWYKLQGVWDYAIDPNSGRYTTQQLVNIPADSRYGTVFRRHKLRGRGYSLQFKISSQDGQPFDVIGWTVIDNINAGA